MEVSLEEADTLMKDLRIHDARRCFAVNISTTKINTRQRRVFFHWFLHIHVHHVSYTSGARNHFHLYLSRMNSRRSAKLHAFIFVWHQVTNFQILLALVYQRRNWIAPLTARSYTFLYSTTCKPEVKWKLWISQFSGFSVMLRWDVPRTLSSKWKSSFQRSKNCRVSSRQFLQHLFCFSVNWVSTVLSLLEKLGLLHNTSAPITVEMVRTWQRSVLKIMLKI